MKTILILLLLVPTLSVAQDKWQKLDSSGAQVPVKLGPWHCAKDLNTNLTWEVKSWHENQHYYKATYTWFDPVTGQGVQDGGSCQQGTEWYPCDVSDFIRYMNEIAYCGITHWRLPTLAELKTLVYQKNIPGKLKMNPYIFPRATRGRYMSADRTLDKGDIKVVLMDFFQLQIEQRKPDVVAYVRLVSSEAR